MDFHSKCSLHWDELVPDVIEHDTVPCRKKGMEVAQRGLGRGVFDDAPWPRLRRAGWAPGSVPGKQHGLGTEQEMPKWIVAHRGEKAQVQSSGESCSVNQGANTAKAGCRLCFKENVSLISMCVGLLEEIPVTDRGLDYGASHLCCLTEVISVNVCNTKLLLRGCIY